MSDINETVSRTNKRSTALILLVALLFMLIVADAPGQNAQPETSPSIPSSAILEEIPDETKVLVLRVLLGVGITVSDAMIAYQNGQSVMLSLSEFLQEIEFPIDVDGFEGTAEGWYINKDRTFKMNLKEGELTVDKARKPLPKDKIKWFDGEIFVDISLLEFWFPLKAEYDPREQTVFLKATETLPVEQRLRREAQIGRSTRKTIDILAGVEIKEAPYDMISMPFGDFNYDFKLDKDPDVEAREHNFNMSFTSDLFYMTSRLFISGDDNQGVSNVRFSLGRKSSNGGLLKRLDATEFEIGDVFTPAVPLVASSTDGKGAYVTNFPLNSTAAPDSTDIRGTATPGWDVELYRGETLLGITKVDKQGTFVFENVSLLPGHNDFMLKKYGKFGEIEEEDREFFNNSSVIQPGQFFYKVGANKQDINVIEIDDPHEAIDSREKSARVISQFQVGILKNLSLTTGLVSIPLKAKNDNNVQERANYLNFAINTTYKGVLGKLDLIRRMNDEGHAAELLLQTVVRRFALTFKHGEFRSGFRSEGSNLQTDLMTRSTEFKIDANYGSAMFPFVNTILDDLFIKDYKDDVKKGLTHNLSKVLAMINAHKLLTVPFLSIQIAGVKRVFESGRTAFDLAARVSTSVKKLRLSNTLNYDFDKNHDSGQSVITLDGNALFNYLYDGNLSFRGSLTYDLLPREIFNNLSVSMNYKLPKEYNLAASVSQELQNLKTTNISITVSKAFKHILAGLTGTISTEREMSLAVNLTTGLGQDPVSRKIIAKPRAVSTQGLAVARVFYDNNDDKVFDEEIDEPIQNAKVQINRRTLKDLQTDEDGQQLVSNLAVYTPSVMSVELKSLNDPYASLPNNSFGISPRPGRAMIVDMPVYHSGEIDGTVYIKRDNVLSEAANVKVELIDTKGNLVKDAKTSFDGFYLFDFVPFGTYKVRISEEQMERLNFTSETRHTVTLNDGGDSAYGTDFIIEKIDSGEEEIIAPLPPEKPQKQTNS